MNANQANIVVKLTINFSSIRRISIQRLKHDQQNDSFSKNISFNRLKRFAVKYMLQDQKKEHGLPEEEEEEEVHDQVATKNKDKQAKDRFKKFEDYEVKMTYFDEEGDEITISSDIELVEALEDIKRSDLRHNPKSRTYILHAYAVVLPEKMNVSPLKVAAAKQISALRARGNFKVKSHNRGSCTRISSFFDPKFKEKLSDVLADRKFKLQNKPSNMAHPKKNFSDGHCRIISRKPSLKPEFKKELSDVLARRAFRKSLPDLLVCRAIDSRTNSPSVGHPKKVLHNSDHDYLSCESFEFDDNSETSETVREWHILDEPVPKDFKLSEGTVDRNDSQLDKSERSISPCSKVVPGAVIVCWAKELSQLRELGFEDEAKNAEILETLHAANIGSNLDQPVTVENAVDYIMTNCVEYSKAKCI